MADEEELENIFDDVNEEEENNELENVLGVMEKDKEVTPSATKTNAKAKDNVTENYENTKETKKETKVTKKNIPKKPETKSTPPKKSKAKVKHKSPKSHKILITLIVIILLALIGGFATYYLGYFKLSQISQLVHKLNPRAKIYKKEKHGKIKQGKKKYAFDIKSINIKRLDTRLYALTKYKLSNYSKPKLKKGRYDDEDDQILRLLNQELNDTTQIKKVYKKLNSNPQTTAMAEASVRAEGILERNKKAKIERSKKIKRAKLAKEKALRAKARLRNKNVSKRNVSKRKTSKKNHIKQNKYKRKAIEKRHKSTHKKSNRKTIRSLFLQNSKHFVKLIRVVTVRYRYYKPFLRRLKRLNAKKAICKNEYPKITLLLGPFKDDASRNKMLRYIYKRKISSSAFNLGLTEEEFKQICKPL